MPIIGGLSQELDVSWRARRAWLPPRPPSKRATLRFLRSFLDLLQPVASTAQNQAAAHDVLKVDIQIEQRHPLVMTPMNSTPIRCPDGANAAGKAGSADNDARDHVELEPMASVGEPLAIREDSSSPLSAAGPPVIEKTRMCPRPTLMPERRAASSFPPTA